MGAGMDDSTWIKINITDIRNPAAGLITHVGTVVMGNPRVGDNVIVRVDSQRRVDIMRNHTATHLLHAALRKILGAHARQAGSLVAPDRLRFDFNHPEALSRQDIDEIERFVNEKILANLPLTIATKSLEDALDDGAIALFGEKYDDEVRSVSIGDTTPISKELCGGTHVESTGEVGTFIMISESSVAAGIRRIEAVTGRKAYELIQDKFRILNEAANTLGTQPEKLVDITLKFSNELREMKNQISDLRTKLASMQFEQKLNQTTKVNGINVLTAKLEDSDLDTLRTLADRFRLRHPKDGVIVLASIINERPMIIAAVTEDLIDLGIKAGDLANFVAKQLGGGGGGKPTLAQAGGKDITKIDDALLSVSEWVGEKI
jgi:alanyl-tRNA synthetase